MPIGKACEDIRTAVGMLAERHHDLDDVQATLEGGVSMLKEKAEELRDCAGVWPHEMRNQIHNALANAVAPLSHTAELASREIRERLHDANAAFDAMLKRAEERDFGVRANIYQILTLAIAMMILARVW